MIIILRAAGTTFQGRQKMLATLEAAGIARVWLEPNPDNPHDPNAIKVMAVPAGQLFEEVMHVGYVPKPLAAQLAGHLDQVRVLHAWVTRKEGKKTLGMRLRLDTGQLQVEVKDPRVTKEAETWVAVAFRISRTGEVWVMVGQSGAAWTIRGLTDTVPRAIMQHKACEAALVAIRAALAAGEGIRTVSRMSEGRELYLKALNGVREVS